MPVLHGVLDLVIVEATNLPDAGVKSAASGFLRNCMQCCLSNAELMGHVDPYCVMDVGATRRVRTRFINKSPRHVQWNEQFTLYLADEAEEFVFEIKDADVVGAGFLALGKVPVEAVLSAPNGRYDAEVAMTDKQGNPVGYADGGSEGLRTTLKVQMTFRPETGHGMQLTPDQKYAEVPRTYFPQRRGNRVTLYHDAWQPIGPVPDVLLGSGQPYEEAAAWTDMYNSFMAAEKFIFITGWSVWTDTVLTRVPQSKADSPSLGELLKLKAAQGVLVLMLVWDDKSNNSGLMDGIMATHDQETFVYFKDTEVTCLLCPRQGGMEDSIMEGFKRGNFYSHHQKTIMLDAPPHKAGAKRPVVSYVGGLDLCDGRYDWGDHPLYGSTEEGGPHAADFHQPNITGFNPADGGPREPWHDIHSRIEGPAAYDVLLNFAERWAKQAGPAHVSKIHKLEHIAHKVELPDLFLKFASRRELLKAQAKGTMMLRNEALTRPYQQLAVTEEADPEGWAVQLFRSIDSDSVMGFPKKPENLYAAGLVVGKGKQVDPSIHRAYITAIRRAQHYIYIENQYFLGSAHLWESDSDTPCFHQVPAELMFKICNKIRAREDFRVYVVVPLWPEGVPTSMSVQTILWYQAQTMRMMYKRIARAIAEAGLEGAAPTDYLQFYALGQREARPEGMEEAPAPPPAPEAAPASRRGSQESRRTSAADNGMRSGKAVNAIQALSDAARRFMIYVHSKMLIADDEYIIVGSANINQRSMDGSRDSEIAIGALQEGHTLDKAGGKMPRGQVAGFRLALWKEHLGGAVAPEFQTPSSLACARYVRSMGDAAWQAFVAEEPAPLPCHLMTYPVAVAPDGEVTAIPGHEEFPDLGGLILGVKGSLPPGLTT